MNTKCSVSSVDKNNPNQLLDAFMGIPIEREYYITEWTSDRAITGWWKERDIIAEHGISRGSKNKNNWHCHIYEGRYYSNSYDKDWNLLMNVYTKLNLLPWIENRDGNEMHSYIKLCIPDIKKTRDAIVEYLKWYAGKDPTILAGV